MAGKDDALTLRALMGMVKQGAESGVPLPVWVSAEISELSVRTSGHCYMELVENGPGGISARARAVVWSSSYRMVKAFFEAETGHPLGPGMKVLVRVQVTFSELYSLTLVVTDIEPSFSVGAMELARQKVRARLAEEGLTGMNSSLEMPRLPLDIAVVSSGTAAGYGDFMRHLQGNLYGFVFKCRLFPAVMQGAEAPASVIAALDRISGLPQAPDVVVLIRGGGAKADLACYDDYDLAANVAQFPVPVLTGIGHDRDSHICDEVAWRSFKTPTAAADFLIEAVCAEDLRLESLLGRVSVAVNAKFSAMVSALDLLEQRLYSSDPRRVVSRGFVLAFGPDGRTFASVSAVSPGDRIGLMAKDGVLECVVERADSGDPFGED